MTIDGTRQTDPPLVYEGRRRAGVVASLPPQARTVAWAKQARITQGRAKKEELMTDATIFAGIDVAKARLDIALRPSGESWSVANDGAGITQVVSRLQELQLGAGLGWQTNLVDR